MHYIRGPICTGDNPFELKKTWVASDADFREIERRVSKVTFLQVRNRTGRTQWHDYIYKMQLWKDGRQIPSSYTILENLVVVLDELQCAMGTSEWQRNSRNKENQLVHADMRLDFWKTIGSTLRIQL